ncbi:bifunctional (p)ppGpp synthetase II/ guanosine-3',5'-bis pyrophosphate 3'-pyrophosphohydrolase [Gloeobacter kilaueensis JS1]|uniref:Bifunctional (P)ppGpp synthetase II/ guanosine-3',5'-bis pyrophosphate 3'-pyrophosphohydrolase n=2 Tax=Gloeobacter TaxID=33071 RepID=U5QMA9_GLOK1|nr:bifunctional (p)ppGpp synthetase II/ guanosine-3',5'-bis pyrophosphate 3'-pyrophosphohydrolase [Gloeobacter kilaueensis JS1]
MNPQQLLDRAIEIATIAHAGMVDKAGKPYIDHPRRVMAHLTSPEEKMAAVLHDVVEDTQVSLEVLVEAGFSSPVVAAVDALTKRDGEEVEAYYQRVIANPVALRVKIADMHDNLDLFRIESPTQKDADRIGRYCAIYPKLVQALIDTQKY